ncbi:ABC transporter permease [Pseudonocardia alni]|uniref:ABC transporter permease n=1 Tax=Pseudonocardia alni TaxID=33907 RepID=UPI0033F970D0
MATPTVTTGGAPAVAAGPPVASGAPRVLRGRGTAWLLAPPLAFLAVFLAAPIAVVFTTAIGDGPGAVVEVVTRPIFVDALLRTTRMAVVVTAICLLLGVVYAVALTTTTGRRRGALLAVLFATFWVSLLVRTYGWIVLFQPFGVLHDLLSGIGVYDGRIELLQTPWAMYAGMTHILLPYMVLPVYSALTQLDGRQIAAAQSLGAPTGVILRRIVLPQIRTGVVAGAVLVFVLSLGFYVTPVFLGGPDQLTLGTLIQREFGQAFDFAAASTMGAALLVLVTLVFVVMNRLFRVSDHWEGALGAR